ncbi:MAG: PRC-barrel domain-containing protein [Chloroflexi bacterium]|nr:PRC-barrel domain-containing protein [Chloroflexota bacterium]
MANVEGIVTENVADTIAPGLTVYDNEGTKVGAVDDVDRATGYMMVGTNPFSSKDLYIPFGLITNIDPRELYLSRSKDELHRDYANPPARSTVVVDDDGKEVATTTEPSGYDGAPVVVERAKIDHLKKRIATGDQVYTSDSAGLGRIKQYDPATGWMMVERSSMSGKHDLMVPVTVVDDVNTDEHEVQLAVSQADLQRMQHLEPANVVFVQAQITEEN